MQHSLLRAHHAIQFDFRHLQLVFYFWPYNNMLSWAVVYCASFPSDPSIAVCIYPYTRGSQKVMSNIFYFMLFTSWTCQNFTELHDNIAESIHIFQFSLHLCRQSSSTFLLSLLHSHWSTVLCSASLLA
jgi:hypothetical protein